MGLAGKGVRDDDPKPIRVEPKGDDHPDRVLRRERPVAANELG